MDGGARALVRKVSGPLGTTYCCPFCMYVERMRKGQAGVGRGYGLAVGSSLHAKVTNHIKAQHADLVPAALEKLWAKREAQWKREFG
jgi:hypothetical protein